MLPTLIMLAATATPVIAPGSYTYAASLEGKPVGQAVITVKAGPPVEIDEQAKGTVNGQSSTADATLLLGPDLAPTSYVGNYTSNGSPIAVKATLTPTTATVGTASFSLTNGAKHFVVAELGLTAGLIALPAQMQAWNNATAVAVIPVMAQMGATVPFTPDATVSATRPEGVPAQDTALTIGGQYPFTIWYDPATNVPDEIDLPSQNIVVKRVRN